MQTPEKLIWMFILMFFLFFVPDMVSYGQWSWKAREVSDFAVEKMASGGGWTTDVETKVYGKLDSEGFKPEDWNMSHTEGLVRAPGIVQFHISSKYKVKAFGVFGDKFEKSMGDSIYLTVQGSQQMAAQIY
ncbi:hypothetical protein [Paenibacillus sp. Leaf72]|uniref:hypothetical protein n=1 Tax=Paenibacillus sp. Leaf72 TaxID=1736234 RepID=UPI0006FE32EA|nr:hypothetical protein [Paenibacillus sp. Leaf72]KQN97019.1 hypothetical protein ASF12_23405 [Paenibacillus sp. Leaf72]